MDDCPYPPGHRRVGHDLRPPMLDAFGLVGAVRQLYDEEGDIAFDFRSPNPMHPLPAPASQPIGRSGSARSR